MLSTLLRGSSRTALVLAGLLVVPPLAGCAVEPTAEGEAEQTTGAERTTEAAEEDDTGYGIDWADVDIGLEERTMEVPEVDVYTERERVVVPYIDIDWNGTDDESVERELAVDVELAEPGHEVYIDEIYGSGDELIVVARLNRNAGDGGKKASDRMVVKGPETDIEYYLVTADPEIVRDEGNTTVVRSADEIPADLSSARRIYGYS